CDLAGILVVIVGSPVAGRRLWWDGKRELRPESRHPICPGEYPASGPSYRRRNARAARRASGPAASMGPLGARLWSQQHGAIDGNELTLFGIGRRPDHRRGLSGLGLWPIAIDPNWYVNGIAGFGWQTYKTQRVVSFFGTNVNNGSFDGQSYQLYAETGYALHPAFLPQTRVTPYLGLGYLHAHTNGFTETGSTTVLSVQAMDPNSFTTTLGARA